MNNEKNKAPEEEKIVETQEKEKPIQKKETNEKEKKEEKKVERKPKEKAIAIGRNLPISTKYSKAICKTIKNKTPEKAIQILELVIKKKFAIPMNNMELPHRKKIMAGRYPTNAAKHIIPIIKQLNANASINQINNPIITIAKADKASRPYRREGRKAKRTHIYLEARERK